MSALQGQLGGTIYLTNHPVFPAMLLIALHALSMIAIKVSVGTFRGFFIGAILFTA